MLIIILFLNIKFQTIYSKIIIQGRSCIYDILYYFVKSKKDHFQYFRNHLKTHSNMFKGISQNIEGITNKKGTYYVIIKYY